MGSHLVFGYENKNGIIKTLSHSKYKILNQIIFNIEVQQTLQLVHHKLAEQEDASTMNFINETSHFMPDNLENWTNKYIYCLCPSNIMLKGMMYMASY